MSEGSTANGDSETPAAWYADPKNPAHLRWWDGVAWTTHTLDPEAAAPAPGDSATAEPSIAAKEPALATAGAAADAPAAAPAYAFTPVESANNGYVPMRDFGGAGRDSESYENRRPYYGLTPLAPTGSAHTTAVWLLATLQVGQLVVMLVLNSVLGLALDSPAYYLISVAFLVASLLLASRDGRRLRERGFRSVGAAWMLLPPVFFILRIVRVGKASVGPLVTWVAVQAAVTVAIAMAVVLPQLAQLEAGAQPLTAAERAEQLTPEGMSVRLHADLTGMAGMNVSELHCPAVSSVADGAIIDCPAIMDGQPVTFRVEVVDSDPYTPFYVIGLVE